MSRGNAISVNVPIGFVGVWAFNSAEETKTGEERWTRKRR